jgi:2,3-bisphosphoglycerate-independent phosphoglycerate mutase
VVFTKDKIAKTIGEVVADHGLTQLRIAETEKYPHVTFFFSGGREAEFKGESRILIPSPKVATYDMQPEMSANEITEKVRNFIDSDKPDFICLNFANTDMVGHTGDFEAAIKAAETVDSCLGQCVSKGLEHDYEIIIIADHGNSDIMKNADGSTHTAHTTNLVPIIYASNNVQGKLSHGKLGDVAVTLLDLMGVPKDELMTGKTLIV